MLGIIEIDGACDDDADGFGVIDGRIELLLVGAQLGTVDTDG